MGPPMLIGAGLGALSSAAMGKSPFTGALMGGALGGLGGAGGLFGGAAGGGAGATAATAAEQSLLGTAAATEGAANMGNIGMANMFNTGAGTTLGSAGTYAQGLNPELYTGSQGMFDVAQGSTLGYNPAFLGGQGPATFAGGGGYDPSFFGRVKEAGGNAVSGVKDMFGGLSTSDKLGLGLKGVELAMQPTPPIQPASGVQPIQQKPFDPSSAIAAAPSYGITKEEVAAGKVGQIASKARLNDEDERKIRQFYTSLIG